MAFTYRFGAENCRFFGFVNYREHIVNLREQFGHKQHVIFIWTSVSWCMAKYEHYHTKFEPGNCYHIYNRSVDRKPMFRNEGNYRYFLLKLFHYLDGFIDIYAYSLLGNHFHLVIRIKDFTSLKEMGVTQLADVHPIVSKQFRRFFQCYTLSFNKQHNRIGTLFQTPYKRVHITDDQVKKLIRYTHTNPQKHQLVGNFKDWKWSSYHALLNNTETLLDREAVIKYFGSAEKYLLYHRPEKLPEDCDLSIE